MHYKCLIVDDELELAKTTCEYFQMFDVSCAFVATAKECEEFLAVHKVDLLLLDINLEEGNGFHLCKKVRSQSDMPILFISARQSDDDVLIALNIGGDDYVKKPYTLSILLAKVKVTLKRMVNDQKPISSNALIRLEEATMKAYVGEREVSLKAREFKLLSYLFQNKNRIITKNELFSSVWGNEYFSDGTLNVHIRKLREKIEENPNEPKWIRTVWGVGYIMEL